MQAVVIHSPIVGVLGTSIAHHRRDTVVTAQTSTTTQPRVQASGLRGVIARHPLISFFVLADLLSWIAWIPYILSGNGLHVLDFSYPDPLTGQLLGMLPGAYLGPIFSAFLVTAIADGRAGLRAWGSRLLRWRINWRWYAGVLLGVPAVLLATGALFSGGNIQAPAVTVLIAYVPGLVVQMLTTGLAEEPGWRDFALPRLQRRGGPMLAVVALGPAWALWHMPLFFTQWGGWPDADWTRPVLFTAFCIVFNIIMIWIFNRSGESLPLAMLLHASLNNFASIVWSAVFPAATADVVQLALLVASSVAATVLLIATRGRLGYRPSASPRR
jgi:membrane protease YdiL (CAAX protease family)